MATNFWGRYRDVQPTTHFDPLQTFIEEDHPVGFRVNFMPDRGKRPREQHIPLPKSFLQNDITEEEITKSPLYRVLHGQEPAVPLAGDDEVLGDPSDDEVIQDFSHYKGISIMNKFSPLGLYSKQAAGVAMVNFPSSYTRTLDRPQLNFDLLRPMRTSLRYLMEGKGYRTDLKTPLVFFNIGPSSGASLRYIHGQSYAIPRAEGLNSYAYQKAFESNVSCLTCKIATQDEVTDHLGQVINYEELTVWEDENVRVIYPYAPLRTMGTRIIPKVHVDYLGSVSDSLLMSLATALSVADYLMNAAVPATRRVRMDRTIPFRQTTSIGKDFHMFIDLLPPFPLVAAETVDFLGMTPFRPTSVAERMKRIPVDHLLHHNNHSS